MRFSGPAIWLWAATLVSSVSAQSDPCTEFAEHVAKAPKFEGLNAALFRRCILNVPFNKAKATDTLSAVRRFLDMSSATIYYTDPTPELELEPFVLNKTLDTIESKINDGKYPNNWSFDHDVVQMFQMFRDGHTDYETRCTHGYMYQTYVPITAIAGKGGTPEIYSVNKNGNTRTLGEKIIRINDQDPGLYLAEYIKTTPEALDWIDPDARFNAMMYSWPSGASSGRFAYRNLWDGEDIKITWANGTVQTLLFTVGLTGHFVKDGKLLFSDTKSLTDLCMAPVGGTSMKKEKRTIATRGTDLAKRATTGLPVGFPQDPEAVFKHENGMLTYSLSGDKQTVVLVLRSFMEPNDPQISSATFVQDFSKFISNQLDSWKSKGYTRLIIDVTGNGGGKAILPYDVLKQFFPTSEEFLYVNMRYSPLTWAYIYSLNQGREQDEWQKLDGTDFSDFRDFVGPVMKDKDLFSKMWRQDYVQFGRNSYGLPMDSYPPTNPFMPDDIVIVSDSLCGSACHSFVEGMRTRGVRTYAFGGRSHTGPMQALGGTKGGKLIDYSTLKSNVDRVLNNDTAISLAGPRKSWELPALPINIINLSINTENKFRKGYSAPAMFLYTAACNRFYLTAEMFEDPRKMWEKVRDMAWDQNGKVIPCKKYDERKDSKMKSYMTDVGGDGTSGEGYDAFAEGTAVDGSGRASKNDPNANLKSSEQNFRNLGQLVWRKMGRKG